MQVETYEEVSIDEQGGMLINEQVSEEALALIESLDLNGQRSLVSRDEAAGEAVERRIPYRLMTREEANVYAVMCPRRTALERYSDGPIPLRVLQVAAHAKPLFKALYVLHPASARDDDPVLIGMRTNPDRSWQDDIYILARWGAVLVPLDEMRAQAKVKLQAAVSVQVRQAKVTIDAFEQSLAEHIEAFLHGMDVTTPAGVQMAIDRPSPF